MIVIVYRLLVAGILFLGACYEKTHTPVRTVKITWRPLVTVPSSEIDFPVWKVPPTQFVHSTMSHPFPCVWEWPSEPKASR